MEGISAILNYKKALELDPDDRDTARMIALLRYE